MWKRGLLLAAVLFAGCATPPRDAWDGGRATARECPAVVEFLAFLVYGLGQWLGPRT